MPIPCALTYTITYITTYTITYTISNGGYTCLTRTFRNLELPLKCEDWTYMSIKLSCRAQNLGETALGRRTNYDA